MATGLSARWATAATACALATVANAMPAPLLHWRFDEPGGEQVGDSAGTIDRVQGGHRRLPGVIGNALVFDGYTTLIERDAAASPVPDAGFTITAWLAPATYPWNRVPLLGQEDGGLAGYALELGPRGELVFTVAVDGRRVELASAEPAVPLRQWSHVAARFEPAAGLSLHVNGRRIAARELPPASPAFGRVPSGHMTPAGNLSLIAGALREPRRPAGYHRRAGSRPDWYAFDGLLDELALYGEALPARAIARAARAFSPGAPALEPRRLPSGPPGPGRFGAYPTTLAYYPEWDALSRVGPHADLVVRFDASPARVVFWRGTQYSPAWVSGNGLWMADQSVEGYDDDYTWEHMNDKDNRYSHVRIVEQHDARVVVHWRYAPVNVEDELLNVDPRSGQGVWIDEYYTFWPDAAGTRKVTWRSGTLPATIQFQESIPLAHPGQRQGEVVEAEYVTVGNLAGETRTLAYADGPRRAAENLPEDLVIQRHNLRADERPFIVFEPGNRMTWLTSLDAGSLGRPGSSSHWPVGRIRSDGRTAQAADRATSFLGFPISEPPIHRGADGRDHWTALYGMSDAPFSDLVALARSWSRPPVARVDGDGYVPGGYERSERAYVLQRRDPAAALSLHIAASPASPLVNLPLLVRDWGEDGAGLEIDGRGVPRGPDFRYGLRHRLDGTDLVAFIRLRADRPVRVLLVPSTTEPGETP